MAKLGYLYLRKGQWDGQQIVSTANTEESIFELAEKCILPAVQNPQ